VGSSARIDGGYCERLCVSTQEGRLELDCKLPSGLLTRFNALNIVARSASKRMLAPRIRLAVRFADYSRAS
jgi:hypothetical protein